MNSDELEYFKENLDFLKGEYDVVVFGSFVEGGMRPNSDIDIAIITKQTDKESNIKVWKNLLGMAPLKFDLRVFELLPIYIQISIIENFMVIFGDLLEISEYFYQFRKKWDDCKDRILTNQFQNISEKLELLERRIEHF
jgi:predicted nucleotidyltransferase